jgi:hypothetical protein
MDEHAETSYEYELQAHSSIIATGRLTLERRPEPGETITLGHESVTVSEILPRTGMPSQADPATSSSTAAVSAPPDRHTSTNPTQPRRS